MEDAANTSSCACCPSCCSRRGGILVCDVQEGGPWAARNLVPLACWLLSWLTLHLGDGRWSGAGMRMPLGTLGFAIPALGLTAYLHYAYSVNLNDMFSDAVSRSRFSLPACVHACCRRHRLCDRLDRGSQRALSVNRAFFHGLEIC